MEENRSNISDWCVNVDSHISTDVVLNMVTCLVTKFHCVNVNIV